MNVVHPPPRACIGWTESRVGIFEEEEGFPDGLPLVALALPQRRRRGPQVSTADGVPGAEHGERHSRAAEQRAEVDLGVVPLDGGELDARDGGRQRMQLRQQGTVLHFPNFPRVRIKLSLRSCCSLTGLGSILDTVSMIQTEYR